MDLVSDAMTPVEQWETICIYFKKVKQDFPPPTAKRMINSIKDTPFWQSLEHQFGPCPK